MKVKVLNRDPRDYLKTRSGDLPKLPRNADPTLHPHSAQREYSAALNAVKLERVFAKPFVGCLDGIFHIFILSHAVNILILYIIYDINCMFHLRTVNKI